MFSGVLTAAQGELYVNNVNNVGNENVVEENDTVDNEDEANNQKNAVENESEPSEETSENTTENVVEVTEEESVDNEQNVEEVNTDQNQSIQLLHHDGHEGFSMTISKVVDGDGNPYTKDNPLGINDEFKVKVNWELVDGHNYKPEDYEIIQLPKEVYIPTELEGELKDENSGDIIANYVVNTDGTVTLRFTEFIENYSQVNGWIEVFAKLDPHNVEDDGGNVTISPIEDEGGISLPLDRKQIEKTMKKQGEPNRSYNADEIEWTVTINKNALFLEDAKLTDLLPEGTKYVDGSVKIEKYPATINGKPKDDAEPVTGITPSADGNKLTIPLGDINDVYVIKYTTKVTDDEVNSFNNNVTLTDKDLEDTSADVTITINRGEPLEKGTVSEYDPKTGIITWFLEFNYDQKQLDDVTLADSWTYPKDGGSVDLVDGSLTFQEMTIDENGHATPEGEPVNPSEIGATLTKKDNGFEVSGISTNKPYKVVYQTKVSERVLEEFRMENTASFDDNTANNAYNIGQFVGKKSTGKIDYAEKTIEWTITVNEDHHLMKDVIIEDTLGEGLTLIEDSVEMTIGGQEYTDFEIEDPMANPFKITNIGDTNQTIIITYKTNYDPNELPENYHAHNKANIGWIPKDSDDRINKDVEANTPVNQETIDASWKNASYDPDTKEIAYEIIANYRENFYNNFKIIDEPQQNQKLVEDSIEVYELTINTNGSYEEDGEKLNIEPSNTDNSFTLDFGETDRAYKITYKTTLEDLDEIQDRKSVV